MCKWKHNELSIHSLHTAVINVNILIFKYMYEIIIAVSC